MTPSQYIKDQGITSLAFVAGEVRRDPSTIHRWFTEDFRLLDLVIKGLLYERENDGN